MTITELHANETQRREEFPVARDCVYLAHAGVCPLPRRVAAAVGDCAQQGTRADQEEAVARDFLADTRGAVARLLGCSPAEVALVGPTSLALSFVAAGLPFQPGDEVLVYFDDYPTNVYPWMALQARGVQVRWLRADALGQIHADQVLAQVREQTRLVALASCHFISGWRIDYATIGQGLRQRGIWFCLDAIQTLGAFPLNVEHVDFLAADAHKWLLGPCAAGVLYVREAMQDTLAAAAHGWHNVRCPNFVTEPGMVYRSDARKYEAGSANLLGAVGLRAAVDLLGEIGIEAIAAELLRKRARLVPALRARGFEVLGAEAPKPNVSGLVSCFRPGADMAALHGRLAERGIVTSLRTDRAGQHYLRLSPHFYNTDAELDRALDALQ